MAEASDPRCALQAAHVAFLEALANLKAAAMPYGFYPRFTHAPSGRRCEHVPTGEVRVEADGTVGFLDEDEDYVYSVGPDGVMAAVSHGYHVDFTRWEDFTDAASYQALESKS